MTRTFEYCLQVGAVELLRLLETRESIPAKCSKQGDPEPGMGEMPSAAAALERQLHAEAALLPAEQHGMQQGLLQTARFAGVWKGWGAALATLAAATAVRVWSGM